MVSSGVALAAWWWLSLFVLVDGGVVPLAAQEDGINTGDYMPGLPRMRTCLERAAERKLMVRRHTPALPRTDISPH